MLAAFRLDFHRLSVTERRILLAVAEAGALDEDGIRARLADCADVRLISLLHALEELGHLRRCDEGWAAGSEFLLRWLQDNSRQLAEELRNEDTPAAGGNDGAADMEALARTLGISPERIQALAGQRITSDSEFFEVIKRFFYEIRYLVEQDDGHKLLVTTTADGAPVLRSEEDVQIALKHWLRPMCRTKHPHGPQALTGRLSRLQVFHRARLPLSGRGEAVPQRSARRRHRHSVAHLYDRGSRQVRHLRADLPDPSGYLSGRQAGATGGRAQHSHGVGIGVVDIRPGNRRLHLGPAGSKSATATTGWPGSAPVNRDGRAWRTGTREGLRHDDPTADQDQISQRRQCLKRLWYEIWRPHQVSPPT